MSFRVQEGLITVPAGYTVVTKDHGKVETKEDAIFNADIFAYAIKRNPLQSMAEPVDEEVTDLFELACTEVRPVAPTELPQLCITDAPEWCSAFYGNEVYVGVPKCGSNLSFAVG